jgi:hypothetical protein
VLQTALALGRLSQVPAPTAARGRG